jgi:long-chain acyl-CoA synthetase
MRTYDAPALIVSAETDNVTDLLINRVAETPKLAIYSRAQQDGSWVDVSAEDFLTQVQDLAKGLIASGIQPGQAVAIMSRTRYEWTLLDFALWFAGAVPVPI